MPSRVNSDERTIPSCEPSAVARSTRILAVASLCLLIATGADAQIGTLTLIAPASPGGGWDQTARAMQQALQQSGGAKIVKVVNIAGAGGTVGLAQFVSAQKGKGDVLMVTGLIMVGAVLTNKSPVTLAQVTPIARLTGEYEVLVVPAASPYRTLGEFIKAWKTNPGLPIAGGSAGGTDHMLTGLLAAAAGVDVTRMNYVPHSGGGETIASLVGNQVPAGVNGLAEFTSLISRRTSAGAGDLEREAAAGHRHPDLRRAGRQPDARQLARRDGAAQHHLTAARRAVVGRRPDAAVGGLEDAGGEEQLD